MNPAATRLRVMHLVLSLEPGGLENGVVNVINRLDPQRFESSVCCLKYGGEFVHRIADRRVVVHEMNWRGGNDWRLLWRLAGLFRRMCPDVVHTRNAEPFFYGFAAAKLARVPALVHSEHGRTFSDRRIRLVVQRWMMRYTDAVFSVSEQLKADLVRYIGIPATTLEVLHNGVDLQRFAVAPTLSVDGANERGIVRREWGIGAGEIAIGSVGRLVTVKNYGLLLRAFAAARNLADGLRAAHVVLIGEGGERVALQAQAVSLGIADRVHFLGHREDVARLLPALDIFVLPSLSEGMSNTLLEAMAAGVAPIASDVGGNSEIVRDGVSGWLFPNADESALTQCLMAACADAQLRADRAAAARDRVRSEFDIRVMIARYEQLYQRVSRRAA